MYRCISLFAFILSVFVFTKLSAQSLIKPLPKATLEKQLSSNISDAERIKILMEILRYYVDYADEPHRMDSVMQYYNMAQRYNVTNNVFVQDRMHIFNQIINCIKTPTQPVKQGFLPLIKECHQKNDKINEAFAWSEYASSIDPVRANDSIIEWCYQNATQLSRDANETQSSLNMQTTLAGVHVRQLKYDLAERELLDVINSPKANTENLLAAFDGITDLYFTKGIFEKALYYGLKSERLMENSGDSVLAINYFGRLSNINMTFEKFDQSIYWAKRAMSNAIVRKDYKLIYKIANGIVAGYLKLNNTKEALHFINQFHEQYKPATIDDKRMYNMELGNIYMIDKKYPLAEKYYTEMYQLGNQEKEADFPIDERATNNFKLGNLYVLMGQYKKAKPFLDKSIKDYEAYDRLDLMKMAHLVAFRADSALGLYPSAIRHLQKGQQLYDSIFNTSRNKQIEELQISYQTEKKEKDIAVLRGLEKQQSIKLLRSENTKNLIIIGSCLLAIIVALLIWQNRSRKKNNQIITQKNEHLEQLISEKDWLLKEVHHRVKNNLHTVICLLESQANYLENDALKAIETSQHRIYAMSLIHQKLYQSDDIKTIDMHDYIGELIKYLKESFGPIENISITFAVPSVKLGVTHAIPLGLIINEAVTNAIQHAFPGNIDGSIYVELKSSGNDVTLRIEDDGVGIDYDIHKTEVESLGMELIKGLTKELKGTVNFKEENGTKIIITFSVDPLEKIIFQNEPEQELV